MDKVKISESEEEPFTELGNTLIVEKAKSHSAVKQQRKDVCLFHDEDPKEQR